MKIIIQLMEYRQTHKQTDTYHIHCNCSPQVTHSISHLISNRCHGNHNEASILTHI